jgi:hypothetical protein
MLHVLAFAGVAAVGAVVGWRLTGVRARFTERCPATPRRRVRAATAAAFLAVAVFVRCAVDRTGCARWTSGSSSGATVVAAGLAAVAYLYFAAVSLLLAESTSQRTACRTPSFSRRIPSSRSCSLQRASAGGSWAPLGRAAAGGGILFGFFWLVRHLGRGAGTGGGARRARRRRREARGCDRHGPGIHRPVERSPSAPSLPVRWRQ